MGVRSPSPKGKYQPLYATLEISFFVIGLLIALHTGPFQSLPSGVGIAFTTVGSVMILADLIHARLGYLRDREVLIERAETDRLDRKCCEKIKLTQGVSCWTVDWDSHSYPLAPPNTPLTVGQCIFFSHTRGSLPRAIEDLSLKILPEGHTAPIEVPLTKASRWMRAIESRTLSVIS